MNAFDTKIIKSINMCMINEKNDCRFFYSNVIYVMYKNFTKKSLFLIISEKKGGGIKYLSNSEFTRQDNSNDIIGNQMHFLS